MEEYLKHWGILDMHWGIRRFQNPDGSLTPAGRERYGVGPARSNAKTVHELSDDELKKVTDRLYKETNYLNARNKYIESQQYYCRKISGCKRYLTGSGYYFRVC